MSGMLADRMHPAGRTRVVVRAQPRPSSYAGFAVAAPYVHPAGQPSGSLQRLRAASALHWHLPRFSLGRHPDHEAADEGGRDPDAAGWHCPPCPAAAPNSPSLYRASRARQPRVTVTTCRWAFSPSAWTLCLASTAPASEPDELDRGSRHTTRPVCFLCQGKARRALRHERTGVGMRERCPHSVLQTAASLRGSPGSGWGQPDVARYRRVLYWQTQARGPHDFGIHTQLLQAQTISIAHRAGRDRVISVACSMCEIAGLSGRHKSTACPSSEISAKGG